MPLTPYQYACLTNPNNNYRIPKGWKENKDLEIHHFDGFDAHVYINNKTKELVIVFEGSNQVLKDWPSNLITFGLDMPHNQFLDAAVFTRAVLNKFPDFKPSFAGHSLGGYLAEGMSMMFGHQAVSFDAPGSGALYNYLGLTNLSFPDTSKIQHYVSDPDRVNLTGSFPPGMKVINIFNGKDVRWDDTLIPHSERHNRSYWILGFDKKTGRLKRPKTSHSAEVRKLEMARQEKLRKLDKLERARKEKFRKACEDLKKRDSDRPEILRSFGYDMLPLDDILRPRCKSLLEESKKFNTLFNQ